MKIILRYFKETFWENVTEHFGTVREYTEHFGTIREYIGKTMKKLRFVRR